MAKESNIITAAIDHLGGGSTGVKRVGVLLDLTTQRVYQLVRNGVVRKPEHAKILADATGLPFEAFLLRDQWQPEGDPGDRGGRRDPKVSSPLTIVPPPASSLGAPGSDGASSRARLGDRVGRVIRPSRSARSWKRAA